MSRNTDAFTASMLATSGKYKEAAAIITKAKTTADAALILAQMYREVDIDVVDKVEQALKENAA